MTSDDLGRVIRAMRRALGYNLHEMLKAPDAFESVMNGLYAIETVSVRNGRRAAYLKWFKARGIDINPEMEQITIDMRTFLRYMNPNDPTTVGRRVRGPEDDHATVIADETVPTPVNKLPAPTKIDPNAQITVRDLLEFIAQHVQN